MHALSLLKPTGHLTLGNLLGALAPMRARQDTARCFYGIADLHALTVPHDPARLRRLTTETATLLLAAGLDRSTLFVQSHVPAHAELSYLLESTVSTGELNRMIQFKEKGRGRPTTRASLFTYPALMAADILLYRPEQVPVGDDQRQHVELTRDLAQRFNRDYGPVFTVPEIVTPPAGARVMDLADPTTKMGKSHEDGRGIVHLLDPPDVVRRKVARAVTDSDTGPDAVRPDREAKPGVTNLLEVLVACGGDPAGLTTYGALKAAVTDAVVALLEPLQRSYAELAADPAHVRQVYAEGAATARGRSPPRSSAAAKAAIGLALSGVPCRPAAAAYSTRRAMSPDGSPAGGECGPPRLPGGGDRRWSTRRWRRCPAAGGRPPTSGTRGGSPLVVGPLYVAVAAACLWALLSSPDAWTLVAVGGERGGRAGHRDGGGAAARAAERRAGTRRTPHAAAAGGPGAHRGRGGRRGGGPAGLRRQEPSASSRERSRAASMAERNAARTLCTSSSRTAAAVVPAGEVTCSRSTVTWVPVSWSILPEPTRVWTTSSVAVARGRPRWTPASIIDSTT